MVPAPAALVPAASALACAAVILVLLKRGARLPLDHPNERSLHVTPVPRVGGLGIVAGVLLALALVRSDPWLPAIVAALAAVSYFDDRAHLPIGVRFAAHLAAAVAAVMIVAPEIHPFAQLLLALGTTWMINLYNFMDGSDGLAGGMGLFGFGAYALGSWLAGDGVLTVVAASVAAAASAFLAFNFHPAKVFMGDAGSIPLGFLAASLGLVGWQSGHWPLWFPIVVFSPFIVDASVTLARRMLRREAFWRPHRTHYYQRLVQLGWGHRDTALAEYALMAACGTMALWALGESPTVQWSAIAVVAVAYIAIGAAVDVAWRRYARSLDARSG